MGFDADHVTWVRTSFDEAIQPGSKDFDFNMQQYSITEAREEMVDFSLPYYTSAMAVLTTQSVVDAGLEPTWSRCKARFGVPIPPRPPCPCSMRSSSQSATRCYTVTMLM
jgi:hypothetical protein